MKTLIAGIIFCFGLLCACLAGGEIVVHMKPATEIQFRTGMIIIFAVSVYFTERILKSK